MQLLLLLLLFLDGTNVDSQETDIWPAVPSPLSFRRSLALVLMKSTQSRPLT